MILRDAACCRAFVANFKPILNSNVYPLFAVRCCVYTCVLSAWACVLRACSCALRVLALRLDTLRAQGGGVEWPTWCV